MHGITMSACATLDPRVVSRYSRLTVLEAISKWIEGMQDPIHDSIDRQAMGADSGAYSPKHRKSQTRWRHTMTIETRCNSEESYEFARRSPDFATESAREATGFLSFRRSRSPIRTIELDEDSFFLAFLEWRSFVEFSLGAYAITHQDVRASIYAYSTVSFNSSHGESHQEVGFHNACFIGVVGRTNILDVIKRALIYQKNVPSDMVKQQIRDKSKKGQIYCGQSPDSIVFETDPFLHIEDGCVWAPYEAQVWYTDSQWCPVPT